MMDRADVAQSVEHSLGKGEVTGSIPVISSRISGDVEKHSLGKRCGSGVSRVAAT